MASLLRGVEDALVSTFSAGIPRALLGSRKSPVITIFAVDTFVMLWLSPSIVSS